MTAVAVSTRSVASRPRPHVSPAAPISAGPAPVSDERAWAAVCAKDARWDGRFVYAVASTGIFCRPSCPSRRPRRENVCFFARPGDASAAGFRACLRCGPTTSDAPTANAAVLRARALIDAQPDAPHTLASLGRAAGLSSSQLQRAFTRAVGMSPRAYQDSKRLGTLKRGLRAGETVSRATFAAGFGSASRVYERADASLGMSPGQYRRGGAGTRIGYTIVDAPLGRLLVGTTARGVCAVALGDDDRALERELRAEYPRATLERDDAGLAAPVQAIVAGLRGARGDLGFTLDVKGTAFQWQVWRALQAIPAGETRTYAEVAASLGRPTAARAVARACASNRVALAIPCHRVVRGDGGLGGYKWGMSRKEEILRLEGAKEEL